VNSHEGGKDAAKVTTNSSKMFLINESMESKKAARYFERLYDFIVNE